MSAQHTPAPWHVLSARGQYEVRTPTDTLVAIVSNRDHARLIAATPDLLGALKNMLEHFKDTPRLEQNSFDEPPEPATQWDYEAFQLIGEARAAITMATGEQT